MPSPMSCAQRCDAPATVSRRSSASKPAVAQAVSHVAVVPGTRYELALRTEGRWVRAVITQVGAALRQLCVGGVEITPGSQRPRSRTVQLWNRTGPVAEPGAGRAVGSPRPHACARHQRHPSRRRATRTAARHHPRAPCALFVLDHPRRTNSAAERLPIPPRHRGRLPTGGRRPGDQAHGSQHRLDMRPDRHRRAPVPGDR